MNKINTVKTFGLTLLLASSIGRDVQAQCVNDTSIFQFSFQQKKYELIKEKKTWQAAAACAVERGGHLVHIESQEEQNAVYDAILSSNISSTYTTVNDGGGIAYVWIGATDSHTEGTWLWDGDNNHNGTSFWSGQGGAGTGVGAVVGSSYINWGGKSKGAQKEPDDYLANQDAAAIALAGWPKASSSLGIASEWNDININNTLYYIVEYATPLGLEEAMEASLLKVSPNPANHEVILNAKSTFTQVRIRNNIGLEVMTKVFTNPISNTSLSVDGFETGIYFIEIMSVEGKLSVVKFLKK